MSSHKVLFFRAWAFFGAVCFLLPVPVGIAGDAALHAVVGEHLVGVRRQALGQLRPVAHGQQAQRGQRLVEHVEQGTRQAADAGLRNPEAGGLLMLQRIGFEVVQQKEALRVGAQQGGVGPLLVRRDAPPVAVEAVVAVVALPAGRKRSK